MRGSTEGDGRMERGKLQECRGCEFGAWDGGEGVEVESVDYERCEVGNVCNGRVRYQS